MADEVARYMTLAERIERLERIVADVLLAQTGDVIAAIAELKPRDKQREKQRIEDRLWTRDEAAAYLGVSSQTLAIWKCKGRGPSVTKVGSRAMYQPSAVRSYAEMATVKGG